MVCQICDSPNSNKPKWKSSPPETTDVVIIGNGPAGIFMSFMLHGNLPYYRMGNDGKTKHPDSVLHRILSQNMDVSLIDQDLTAITKHLLYTPAASRNSNPLALLMDALFHPKVDSEPGAWPSFLEWRYDSTRAYSHVVLGRGGVGGSWSDMKDNDSQTLSYAENMELPFYSFSQWLESTHSDSPHSSLPQRPPRSQIARYYRDYIFATNISSVFYEDTIVNSVERCPVTNKQSDYSYVLSGYTAVTKESFTVHARTVVLATGVFDSPKLLPTLPPHSPNVFYEAADFLRNTSQDISSPLLVIGTGFTAADCLISLRQTHQHILHIYHWEKTDSPLRYCNKAEYPDYAAVWSRMRRAASGNFEQGYEGFPDADVISFRDSSVLIRNAEGNVIERAVAAVGVFIGRKLDKSFLFDEKREVTVDDPIQADPFTSCIDKEKTMYAIGAVTGDKFVRFILGGPLGVFADLERRRHAEHESP